MYRVGQVIQEVRNYSWFIKCLILLVAAGVAAAAARFIFGLGATTNLNDNYPWGLWISFDVVTSVPLAAGAFTLGAVVHVFHIKKLEPLVRPAIVTGFLGYALVCAGLLLDLGQPHHAYNIFLFPNLHSPMFEVALCVMSYTTPILPLLFWISAVFTGLSIVIVEAVLVHRHLKQPDETELLATLTRIIPWFLGIYLVLKIYALIFLSARPLFDRPGLTILFMTEMILGIVVPLIIFMTKWARTDSGVQLKAAGMVVFFGLVLNRFNVSMFGMIQENQQIYYPSFLESVVTVGVIAAHILFFALIARYFPIFEHHPEDVDYSIPDHFRKLKKQTVPEAIRG